MPNSVTMIKRSSLILISSAAEHSFFVPEYHQTNIIYNTTMNSRKTVHMHCFNLLFLALTGFGINCGCLFLLLLFKKMLFSAY